MMMMTVGQISFAKSRQVQKEGPSRVSIRVIFIFTFDEIEIPTTFCRNFDVLIFQNFDFEIGISIPDSILIVYFRRNSIMKLAKFRCRNRTFDFEIGISPCMKPPADHLNAVLFLGSSKDFLKIKFRILPLKPMVPVFTVYRYSSTVPINLKVHPQIRENP
jgi:hypothetical protein